MPALAAEYIAAPDNYVTGGMYYLTPGDRPVDYGIGFDLGYATRVGKTNWLEFKLFTSVLESGQAALPDFYASGLGLDFLVPFGDQARSHFYGMAGVGAAMNDVTPDTGDGSSFLGDVGFGWRGAIWENWGMRPRFELRYQYDTVGDGTGDVIAAVKLEIPPKRRMVVEKPVEVEKRVEVPVEVERVVEKQVACVVPAAVEPTVDSDHDGIPDASDSCPNTLAGAKTDEHGCVKKEQKITLPNIEFETGKTVLAAGGKDKLESVVQFLSSQPDLQVDVFGHTDSQGKDEYNLKLSEGRARSVMDYLVSRGIDAKRLSAKGFGESQPIASNETAQGRAQNRRVELLLRTKQ